jgi:hypothetical protein
MVLEIFSAVLTEHTRLVLGLLLATDFTSVPCIFLLVFFIAFFCFFFLFLFELLVCFDANMDVHVTVDHTVIIEACFSVGD